MRTSYESWRVTTLMVGHSRLLSVYPCSRFDSEKMTSIRGVHFATLRMQCNFCKEKKKYQEFLVFPLDLNHPHQTTNNSVAQVNNPKSKIIRSIAIILQYIFSAVTAIQKILNYWAIQDTLFETRTAVMQTIYPYSNYTAR